MIQMKKIIITLIMLSISTVFYAQEKLKQPDPKNFLGVWVGSVGDLSYEFEFQEYKHYSKKDNLYVSLIHGSIKYIEKGKGKRVIPINTNNNPLHGFADSEVTARLLYEDMEKKLKGQVKLTIDTSDKKTMKWELGPREGVFAHASPSELEYDLPKTMTLKRK